jgi:hypothetical protein
LQQATASSRAGTSTRALNSDLQALRDDVRALQTELSSALDASIQASKVAENGVDATLSAIRALDARLDGLALQAEVTNALDASAQASKVAENKADATLNAIRALDARLDGLATETDRRQDEVLKAVRHPAPTSGPATAPGRLPLPGADVPHIHGNRATLGPLPSAYFIVGCGRSGTTSLARILDRASNGVCHNEPAPVMGVESRLLHEDRLADPFAVLTRAVAPRVADALDRGLCYGEKNLTLPPFIPYLHALFHCRFVYVRRDGRDVVRSWLDWHDHIYGNIYAPIPANCRHVR